MNPSLSLICVYNNVEQFNALVESFGCFRPEVEVIGLDNRSGRWKSAAEAYFEGAKKSNSQILVFSHQDIRFTDDSFLNVLREEFAANPLQVIGVAGAVPAPDGHGRTMVSGMYQGSKLMRHHTATGKTPVMTLDECLFATSREVLDCINFDAVTCDSWHFYAVDFCLQAGLHDIPSYVIPANLLHLSGGNRDASYYLAQEKIKKKYRRSFDCLATTCGWSATKFIDPYRPIVEDELDALMHADAQTSLFFYLPLAESFSLANTRFFPELDTLRSVSSIEALSADKEFFSTLDSLCNEEESLLSFVISFNNFIAAQNWLYNDLLDLKRDFVAATKEEFLTSQRYQVGHRFVPWQKSNFDIDAVDDPVIHVGTISFDAESRDFSNLLDCDAETIATALSDLVRRYSDSDFGIVGTTCLDVLMTWRSSQDELSLLLAKKHELDAIDREADAVRSAIEKSLAFRIGSGLSIIAGLFRR